MALAESAKRLDDLLLAPVATAVGDRSLVIVPEDREDVIAAIVGAHREGEGSEGALGLVLSGGVPAFVERVDRRHDDAARLAVGYRR